MQLTQELDSTLNNFTSADGVPAHTIETNTLSSNQSLKCQVGACMLVPVWMDSFVSLQLSWSFAVKPLVR